MRSAARVAMAIMVSWGFTPSGPAPLPSTINNRGPLVQLMVEIDDRKSDDLDPCGKCPAGGS